VSGTLPGSGSRARSRERGYADAMFQVFAVARELERGPLPPAEALDFLAQYAFDAYAIGEVPRVTLAHMHGWIGRWQDVAP
jgi:hypothetical protein